MSRGAAWPVILVGVGLAAVALLVAEGYRRAEAPARPLLPVAFVHADHSATQCIDCHHNFVDSSGGGTCYNCHKQRPALAGTMEDMFHNFCFTCHIDTQRQRKHAGPTRRCRLCHGSS